jgi:CheY-like chemotaxis protein
LNAKLGDGDAQLWLEPWLDDSQQLSRELHDDVAPALAACQLALSGLPPGREQALLREGLEQLGRFTERLRSRNVLAALRKQGLKDALESCLAAAERRSGAVLGLRNRALELATPCAAQLACGLLCARLVDAWVEEPSHSGTLTLGTDGSLLHVDVEIAAAGRAELPPLPSARWPALLAALGGGLEVRLSTGGVLHAQLRARLSRKPGTETELSREAGPRRRVLVIDDEPVMGRVIQRLLQPRHDVDLECMAPAALARLEAGASYDAIVCDVLMPRMSGGAFLAALARRRPELSRRVIFVTGGAQNQAVYDFLSAVPNARIEKPFSAEVLEREIEQCVRAAGDAPETGG